MVTFSCDACSAINATNAKFCNNCGASLSNLSLNNQSHQGDSAPNSFPRKDTGALISDFVFAGFLKRFVAYIIDGALFTVAFILVMALFSESTINLELGDPAMFGYMSQLYLYFCIAWWLYFALMEASSMQGTLGKKIIGIKVVDEQGQRIGFGKATLRHFSSFLSYISLSVGYLMAAFTKRKQALHDIVASCLVVNKRFEPSQIKVASDNPSNGMSTGGIIAIIFVVLLIPIGGIIAAISIPAYHDYTLRVQVVQTLTATHHIKATFAEYASQTGYWPNTFERAGLKNSDITSENYNVIFAGDGAFQIVFVKPPELARKRLNFIPKLTSDGNYEWRCFSDDIDNRFLPNECRSE